LAFGSGACRSAYFGWISNEFAAMIDWETILDLASDEWDDPWYYYANTAVEYYCRFGAMVRVPDSFHGPFDCRAEAVEAYREWLEDAQDREAIIE
jgi:hypothetical protein